LGNWVTVYPQAKTKEESQESRAPETHVMKALLGFWRSLSPAFRCVLPCVNGGAITTQLAFYRRCFQRMVAVPCFLADDVDEGSVYDARLVDDPQSSLV
jgi:hypothetical protein